MRTLDAFRVEILSNALAALTEEIQVTLLRSAYSQVVKEAQDASCAIFTDTGRIVAQPVVIPGHLGSMKFLLLEILTDFPAETLQPGDVLISNHPYRGGSHLPDIGLFRPVFVGGDLLGFAGTIIHYTDVGGMVPGSNPARATELYQEGLVIPPAKLFEAGRENTTLRNIIRENVRRPDIFFGDLMAQDAALRKGEQRLLDLANTYGVQAIRQAMQNLIDNTERQCRAAIAAIHRADRPQLVIGLLCAFDGCPVAVEVFEGNAGDPTTVPNQIEETLRPAGLDWITALWAPAIRQLAVEGGPLQPSRFDTRDMAEIASPDFPGERLVVCKNPLLAEQRARNRSELLAATENDLARIHKRVQRAKKPLRGAAEIGKAVGAVIGKRMMAKHFETVMTDDSFVFTRKSEAIADEAKLDGISVVRTSLTAEQADAATTVRSYKSLARVERAFRCMKTVDLELRPVFHWMSPRVRAHVLLCMLAYYLTDEEPRIMPVAGGGFDQCYNAQAVVAAGSMLVVAADVVQAPNDKQQLVPMLNKVAELLADNGYYSEGNVNACDAAGIDPLIAMGRQAHYPPLEERFAKPPEPAMPSETAEPVFGIIKSVLGFRQFPLRGLDNVCGEWNLVTMAWNIKRMFALGGAI
jgi:hypothetical protein